MRRDAVARLPLAARAPDRRHAVLVHYAQAPGATRVQPSRHQDFNVLSEGVQEPEEPFRGEPFEFSSHEVGHVSLVNAEKLCRLHLGEASFLNDGGNTRDDFGLGEKFRAVWKRKVFEDVAAASLDGNLGPSRTLTLSTCSSSHIPARLV
jgi:hypothetical protein